MPVSVSVLEWEEVEEARLDPPSLGCGLNRTIFKFQAAKEGHSACTFHKYTSEDILLGMNQDIVRSSRRFRKKKFFFFFSSLFKAEHLQKKIIIRSVDWKSSDHLFPSECISLSVAKTITSQRGLNGSSETNSRVEATGSTIGDAGAGTGGWSGVGTSDQTSSDCGLSNKTSSDSGLSNQTSSELLSAESSSNSRLCSKTYSSVSTETSSQLCSCLIWIEYYISCTRF